MNCKYCDAKLNKEDKYCKECGAKIKTDSTPAKPAVTYQSNKSNDDSKKGAAIASLVLGVISLFGGFLIFPIPLVGLILGITNKEKCSEKTAGIITSSIGLFLSVICLTALIGIFSVANRSSRYIRTDYEYYEPEFRYDLDFDELDEDPIYVD